MNRKKYLKRTEFKAEGFVKSLEKKMLYMEKYMESFRESISKRFEKQDENLKNLTDKMKSFEITQTKYKESTSKRLSRLEERRNEDESEDFELQQVRNLNYLLFYPILI